MAKISIIIPHKNTPGLLTRCISSIPKDQQLEVIVVDDDSNEKIVDFNHFPGYDRNNIMTIFTKTGKGAGYVRNIGLQKASGKWVLFADADDFFSKDAFEIMSEYDSCEADIVFFQAKGVMSDDIKKESHRIDYYSSFMNDTDDNRVRYLSNVPWAKLIRRTMIMENNLHFDETNVANDAFFSCQCAIFAKSIIKDKRVVYFCTESPLSLKMKRQSKKDRIIRFHVTMKCNKFLREHRLNKYYNSPVGWYFKSGSIHDWLPLSFLISFIYHYRKRALKDIYWFLKYNRLTIHR
jgi:glycosyltransferase involved in cell wall biosynthesis